MAMTPNEARAFINANFRSAVQAFNVSRMRTILLELVDDIENAGGGSGPGGSISWGDIEGAIGDQGDLASALAAKANVSHTQAISTITGLQAALDAKADTSALTSGLATKANTSHTHTSTNISDFTEAVQDAVAALLGAGSNVILNYDDAANSLTISSTGSGGAGLDAEQVRDAIGVALVGVGNITVTVNDAADTITITTTATQNSTDAALRDRSLHTGTQLASTISDFATKVEEFAPEIDFPTTDFDITTPGGLQTVNLKVSRIQDLVSANTDVAAMKAIIGSGISDGDPIVDTLAELLALFSTYTEGVDIATLINGKAASVHTHTASQITDFTTAVAALMVAKALASELNTGTDDAKFATALALQGSKYLQQDNSKLYVTTAGSANTYTATLSPAPAAQVAGMVVYLKIHAANTGASTLNVNGLGALSIVKETSTALASGDLPINKFVQLIHNGTQWQLISPFTDVLKANLASPTFTGTPSGPTAAAGTNTTQFATTAHVFAERTNTVTLTNKRINPREQTVASAASVTPNADTNDFVSITAQAAALSLVNPSGTPVSGQTMVIRIKDNGTARAITYGTQYRAIGVTLPTTTVISKTLYLGMIWNAADTTWDVTGYSLQA